MPILLLLIQLDIASRAPVLVVLIVFNRVTLAEMYSNIGKLMCTTYNWTSFADVKLISAELLRPSQLGILAELNNIT